MGPIIHTILGRVRPMATIAHGYAMMVFIVMVTHV